MDVYEEINFEGIPLNEYSKIKIPKPAFLESAGITFSHKEQDYSADFEFSRFRNLGSLEIAMMKSNLDDKITKEDNENIRDVSRSILSHFSNYGTLNLWKDESHISCNLIHFKPKHFKKEFLDYFANKFEDVGANGIIAYVPKSRSKKIMKLGEQYLIEISKPKAMKLKEYWSNLIEDIGFESGDLPVIALFPFIKNILIRATKKDDILAQF